MRLSCEIKRCQKTEKWLNMVTHHAGLKMAARVVEDGYMGGGEGDGEGGNNAKNSSLYIRGRWLNTFN